MKLSVYGNQPIITPRDPQLPMEAANKNYVDNSILAHANDVGLHLTSTQNTFLDSLSVSGTEVNYLSGLTSNAQTQLDSKLALAGGTMTGALTLASDPSTSLEAATKQYTDAGDALKVAKSGDTMTGYLTLNAAPTSNLHAATKQYVDSGLSTHASDASLHLTSTQNTFLDGITVSNTEVNLLSGVTSGVQSQLDSKLPLAGGTLTGTLVLSADPTAALQPATKQYTDTADALKVDKAGDTMTGALVLSGAPTADLQASTKKYVDDKDAAQATYIDNQDALKVAKAGDTMTGHLTLNADPTSALHAATKQYVDSGVSGHAGDASLHLTSGQNTLLDAISVSSTEINQLSGVASNVQTQLDSKLPLAGGTLTGALVLSADPAAALQPATKQYTDAADALKVAKAGDTMTGALVLSGNPAANLEAAPKQYVDSTVSTHAADDTKHLTAAQNTFLDAVTVSATEVNQLSGVGSNVQDQINTKFDKAGGLITGDVTLDTGKTIFVSKVPATGTEVVNKSYVDSLLAGQKWQDPVSDINLVADDLTAAPGSPVTNDVYIIGAAPTGVWAGKAGYAVFWDGAAWVELQARAVAVGDRFGVSLTSATVVGATLTAHDNKIVTITNATPGAIQYADDIIEAGSTTLVFDPQSSKFGVSYTRTDEGNWTPTNTSVNLTAGDALSLSGNILNVNYGNGLAVNADVLEVNLVTAGGLEIAGGLLQVNLDGTTLTSSTNGVKVSDTVIADIADKVSKTGSSTVTGAVTVDGAGTLRLNTVPAVAADAVNKGYVDSADANIQGQVTTLQGTVSTLNTDPVTKTYVDTQDGTKVAKAGDTMTGLLTLSADPTSNLHAATKQYVDSGLSTHATDASLHLTSAQNTFIDGITVTSTEVNYLSGVSSNVQTQVDSKLALAGGTLTGALTLSADPLTALQPATKQYTDTADALKVAKAGDTMTGALVLSGAPTADLHAATKKYADDLDAAQATYIDNQDALKVAKAGDTMTGFLSLHADPTGVLHAATKQYVDSNISTHTSDATLHMTAGQNTFLDALTVTSTEVNYLEGTTSLVQTQLDAKLPLAGGTMTGAIELAADPIGSLQPATKQYTDAADALKVNKAGDTLTGFLTLHAVPTTSLHAATKGYVDSGITSHASDDTKHLTSAQNTLIDAITVTSTEINQLASISGNVQDQINTKVNLSGGTMTGLLTLSADPSASLQAATKQYTDAGDALKVAKAGDTMTGALVLSGAPTADLEASTKKYVDDKDAAQATYIDNQDALKVSKAGDTMTGALVLPGNPTANLEAAPKQYVDSAITTLTTYINSQDSGLQDQITSIQSTVNTLNSDPVTKTYVDAQDNTKLAKAGGTMTGYITLHADPQQAMHPASKQYVDAVAQGLVTKPSVRLATTGNLAATYNNGTFGVNSTLTGTANGAISADGKTPLVGDRILVRAQSTALENGDYVVQQIGDAGTPFILKRVSTIDESSEVSGSYFYVYDGLTMKGTGWVMTVADPVTFSIGTDDITINQFSGQGSLIAGAGLTLSGNTIDINSANPARIVVNADSIDLATTGVGPGSYTKVTTDGYGRITAGSNPNTIAGYGITDAQPLNANLTSLSGVSTAGIIIRDSGNNLVTKSVITSGIGLTVTNGDGATTGNIVIVSNATSDANASTLVSRDSSGNFSANIITSALSGNATTATALQTSRQFSVTGDTTAPAVGFDGTGNVVLNTTLADSGVTAGTYTKTTFDAKGRATAGQNPTTLAEYNLSNDAYTKTETDALIADLQAQIRDLHLYIMSRV